MEQDVSALTILLNEYRSMFDKAMREGETFDNLKKLYLQIKELECHLNALEWDEGRNLRIFSSPSSAQWNVNL
jgi:hypothetical protein